VKKEKKNHQNENDDDDDGDNNNNAEQLFKNTTVVILDSKSAIACHPISIKLMADTQRKRLSLPIQTDTGSYGKRNLALFDEKNDKTSIKELLNKRKQDKLAIQQQQQAAQGNDG